MRAVSRPVLFRERWLMRFTVARFDESELPGTLNDAVVLLIFSHVPIIPIRCQELAVAVPRGCAHARKLSVCGT